MRFKESEKRKDTDRPLARCGAMVAPGLDTRWLGVPKKVRIVNSLRAHESRQHARPGVQR